MGDAGIECSGGGAWGEVGYGDRVRLERIAPVTVVEGIVAAKNSNSPWLTLTGIDNTFRSPTWELTIIEKAWRPPAKPGLYVERAHTEQFYKGGRVPLFRRNDCEEWYVASSTAVSGWTLVRAADLPRDLVILAFGE